MFTSITFCQICTFVIIQSISDTSTSVTKWSVCALSLLVHTLKLVELEQFSIFLIDEHATDMPAWLICTACWPYTARGAKSVSVTGSCLIVLVTRGTNEIETFCCLSELRVNHATSFKSPQSQCWIRQGSMWWEDKSTKSNMIGLSDK